MVIGNKVHSQEYVYDFSVDAGATGVIALDEKNGKARLPEGSIVKTVYAHVETACTSAGSATVIWGDNNDDDGYSGSAIAVASLTENAIFNGWDNAAALLWDDSNDHPIYMYNDGTTHIGDFDMTIGTANLTAGKIRFMVEYYAPSGD